MQSGFRFAAAVSERAMDVENLGVGNVSVYQEKNAYRFTSDSVLLAKFAQAKDGDFVADFCAGTGVCGFYFFALNSSKVKRVDMYELQPQLAKLAERAVTDNGLRDVFYSYQGRLQDFPEENALKYDLVLCNPPYQKVGSGPMIEDASERLAKTEVAITFSEIAQIAAKALKHGGRFYFTQRAERLAECFALLKKNKMEPKTMQFVSGKERQNPYLFLAEAVKGGSEGMTVLPAIHNGEN